MLQMQSLLNGDGSIKNKQDFEHASGLLITDAKFRVLTGIATTALLKYTKNTAHEKKIDNLQNFCMRIKKGSKKFRKILEGGGGDGGVSGNISKFADLTDVIINGDNSIRLNLLWKKSFLSNATRTFLFKLHNNLLGMNNRVANFVRGHPRTCTFCDLIRDPIENVENTRHLFFECTCVETAIRVFFTNGIKVWQVN